jgi:hypothetical protein
MYYVTLTLLALAADLVFGLCIAAFIRAGRGERVTHGEEQRVR